MNLRRALTAAILVGSLPFPCPAPPATKKVIPLLPPKKAPSSVSTNANARILELDHVLDWRDPLALTCERFEAAFTPEADGTPSFKTSSDSYGGVRLEVQNGRILPEGFKNGDVVRTPTFVHSLVWGEQKLPAEIISVHFNSKLECRNLMLAVSFGDQGDTMPARVLTELTNKIGKPSVEADHVNSRGEKTGMRSQQWTTPEFKIDVLLPKEKRLVIVLATRLTPDLTIVSANLDPLLDFGEIWKWTSGDMEKHFTVATKENGDGQFEWLSAAKDRARFSRKMLPERDTNVTMFGGSVRVEEAIIEFVNGHSARATVSLYNRGDAGDVTPAEFERMYKKVGQCLTERLKAQPRAQLNSSNAALKTMGWNWTTPAGIALLECNDLTARSANGGPSQPEFLRLKLAAPDQADWSMGKLAVGVQRMALTKNVTKTAEGDTFISGVPMVDQGAKGYCVAASCQRLFEYMRIPCDQHEIANLLSVDAGSGANIMVMQKSLAKVDSKFQVSFKPLVNPLNYYDNRRNRRVSFKEFAAIIKEYVDKGVPLLWGLELGRFEENPPLPNGGQVSGGHMRLIIGYNTATNQVLFTDSWGAGHELKRTKALDAYEETLGLYSMAPRGL